MVETSDVILTISGSKNGIDEITRHIDTIARLTNLKVNVSDQSTLNLKSENAAIHKQCYKEQRKITAIFKYLHKHNLELYDVIAWWKDEDVERIYNAVSEDI
jgi:hypothetical protein